MGSNSCGCSTGAGGPVCLVLILFCAGRAACSCNGSSWPSGWKLAAGSSEASGADNARVCRKSALSNSGDSLVGKDCARKGTVECSD